MENQNYHDIGVQANSPSRIPFKQLKYISNQHQPQSYVPFLFKNTNKIYKQLNNTPAPGQYELKSCFGLKDGRTLLEEKYHIDMENSRKVKQSVAFKSAAKRFNYKEKPDLIPISYSKSQSSKQFNNLNKTQQKFRQISIAIRSSTAEQPNCYPSIPDSSLRYGYTLGGKGKLKVIQKTESQLDNQKEDMRKYVKKLQGQKSYSSRNLNFYMRQNGKNPVIEEVKRKVQQNSQKNFNESFHSSLYQNLSSPITNKKHKHKKSYKGNQFRVSQIMEQKREMKRLLGPGAYDENSSKGFGNKLKPQKFQFFNSTSERFKEIVLEKSHSSIKKNEIRKRIDELQKVKAINFKKGLKRLQRSTQKNSENTRQKTSYDEQRLIRVNHSKNSLPDKGLRIEFNHPNSRTPKGLYSRIYKGSLFHQNSLQKRENIQAKHRYIRIKTNGQCGQSDSSICSWEDRPLSRNDGLHFKENFKNQP